MGLIVSSGNIRISTKLLIINALICGVFILIIIISIWAFRYTKGLIKEFVVQDIGDVTTNALTERELFFNKV